jgi:hypothetical protein
MGHTAIRSAYSANFPEPEVLSRPGGPFTVNFLNKEIGPSEKKIFNVLESWSDFTEENIKHYSGSALYTTTFTVDEIPNTGDIFLNIGAVGVMAEVKLNGQDVGGVWIAPYRLNVTSALKLGENALEIEVVNLWRNRMILDKALQEDERYTWTVVEDIRKGEELHRSGLLGPIQLEHFK